MGTAKKVAVLVYEQVDALDVTGPFDAFAVARTGGRTSRFIRSLWNRTRRFGQSAA
jgi:hypothetical protein